MELSITNTLSYYIVKQAFGSYSTGDKIDIDTYLALTQVQQQNCYSSIVTISFDPEDILIDLTSETFAKATDIQYKTINGNSYVNEFTISIDAISSADLRFYKQDVTQDYTYPNSSNNSIVTITSI